MIPPTDPASELRLARTFMSPREAVFRAWVDAELLEQWFWPWEAAVSVEPRVDGAYSIAARHPALGVLRVDGRYREVTLPERVVFTWHWEGDPESDTTVVTVELHDRGADTELVLTHTGFATASARDQHSQGWTDCLDRLPGVLAAAAG